MGIGSAPARIGLSSSCRYVDGQAQGRSRGQGSGIGIPGVRPARESGNAGAGTARSRGSEGYTAGMGTPIEGHPLVEEGPRMRLATCLAALAALLLFAGTSTAQTAQQRDPAVCINIAQQLVHYDSMMHRAAELGNDMWVARFEAQIAAVEDRHARLCPEQAAAQRSAQEMAELLRMAMSGALTFFTMGAY